MDSDSEQQMTSVDQVDSMLNILIWSIHSSWWGPEADVTTQWWGRGLFLLKLRQWSLSFIGIPSNKNIFCAQLTVIYDFFCLHNAVVKFKTDSNKTGTTVYICGEWHEVHAVGNKILWWIKFRFSAGIYWDKLFLQSLKKLMLGKFGPKNVTWSGGWNPYKWFIFIFSTEKISFFLQSEVLHNPCTVVKRLVIFRWWITGVYLALYSPASTRFCILSAESQSVFILWNCRGRQMTWGFLLSLDWAWHIFQSFECQAQSCAQSIDPEEARKHFGTQTTNTKQISSEFLVIFNGQYAQKDVFRGNKSHEQKGGNGPAKSYICTCDDNILTNSEKSEFWNLLQNNTGPFFAEEKEEWTAKPYNSMEISPNPKTSCGITQGHLQAATSDSIALDPWLQGPTQVPYYVL